MVLHIALKKVVDELSIDVFCTNLLINVLADYRAYQDVPVIKQMLKDFINDGYGIQVKELFEADDNSKLIKLQSLKLKFSQNSGYKDELIEYLFSCISFSLKITSDEPVYSPEIKIVQRGQERTNNSITDFNQELITLQSDYITTLCKLYEAPNNESFSLIGLYSSKSLSQLWLLEQKILVIYKALDLDCNNWCELQRKKYIESRSKNRRAVLNERLEGSKSHYISLLSSLLILPKKIIYSKSGYYDDDALKTLEKEENIIRQLDKSLGTNILKECLNERKRILAKNKQSTTKQFTQIILKLVLPIFVVLFSFCYGMSYYSSIEQIQIYNNNIAIADKQLIEESYIDAIYSYDKASKDYNGSFNNDRYKSDALSKKEIACEKLLQQKLKLSSDLYNNGEYLNARNALIEIKSFITSLELSAIYITELGKLNEQILSAVDRDRNTIILNIATNNGRLNSAGINQLNKLLEVVPEDYWLNLIKNKQR